MTSGPASAWGIGRLFFVMRDAVIVASLPEARIVLWNPAAEELFGCAQHEAVGKSVELIIHPDYLTRHRDALAVFNETGHGDVIDAGNPTLVRALHCDGHDLWVELTLSRIDRDGDEYVLAFIRDATARVTAQAEQVRRERASAAEEVTRAFQALRRPWWKPRKGDGMLFAWFAWMAFGLLAPRSLLRPTQASEAIGQAGSTRLWGMAAAGILLMLATLYPFRWKGRHSQVLWVCARALSAGWCVFVGVQVYSVIHLTLFTGIAAIFAVGALWGASDADV